MVKRTEQVRGGGISGPEQGLIRLVIVQNQIQISDRRSDENEPEPANV
jgi:hypothetical protein